MGEQEYLDHTIAFVKASLENAEAGHDWFHIERVYRLAITIAKEEGADLFVVSLGSLLHDIADSKFHDGDEEIGPKTAGEFLTSLGLEQKIVDEVVDIVAGISFKNSLKKNTLLRRSLEFKVVQDADRLDAIGAIGIARAFNYGGYKNRPFYDPAIAPEQHMSKEKYKLAKSPTINHFYEKLLLLKDQMNTGTGKRMAENRHQYMLGFLDQFFSEWEGKS